MAQKNQSLAGVENDKRTKDQEGFPISMLAAKENNEKLWSCCSVDQKM